MCSSTCATPTCGRHRRRGTGQGGPGLSPARRAGRRAGPERRQRDPGRSLGAYDKQGAVDILPITETPVQRPRLATMNTGGTGTAFRPSSSVDSDGAAVPGNGRGSADAPLPSSSPSTGRKAETLIQSKTGRFRPPLAGTRSPRCPAPPSAAPVAGSSCPATAHCADAAGSATRGCPAIPQGARTVQRIEHQAIPGSIAPVRHVRRQAASPVSCPSRRGSSLP